VQGPPSSKRGTERNRRVAVSLWKDGHGRPPFHPHVLAGRLKVIDDITIRPARAGDVDVRSRFEAYLAGKAVRARTDVHASRARVEVAKVVRRYAQTARRFEGPMALADWPIYPTILCAQSNWCEPSASGSPASNPLAWLRACPRFTKGRTDPVAKPSRQRRLRTIKSARRQLEMPQEKTKKLKRVSLFFKRQSDYQGSSAPSDSTASSALPIVIGAVMIAMAICVHMITAGRTPSRGNGSPSRKTRCG